MLPRIENLLSYIIKSKTFGYLPLNFDKDEDFINIAKAICKLSGQLAKPVIPNNRKVTVGSLARCQPKINQHLDQVGATMLSNCKWDNSELWNCKILDVSHREGYLIAPLCEDKKRNFSNEYDFMSKLNDQMQFIVVKDRKGLHPNPKFKREFPGSIL
ncbi:DgyrCDS14731 [Dimorphilus gyrociliatus]|uniref:DgyrCDS14731 n=1 Tax=Dimorphilus gyrociliatus TaxID=2664684 RepID=A0A7I8WEN3_9ANNE|nr:DgyrCDS14731 [Dimorphilus gyrociliatus]